MAKAKKKIKEEKKKFATRKLAVLSLLIAILIVSVFLALYILRKNVTEFSSKAAVIDQLGSSLLDHSIRYSNQTFVESAKQMLHEKFSIVNYYSDNATVNEYENLASEGYKLIIWRAHSALDLDQKFIAISTSEEYELGKYDVYINNGYLSVCNISGFLFFGITPSFITEIMDGRFQDTVIIFMSCNGLKQGYYRTAEALKEKGVKAFISWDGWINPEDNDNSIELLIRGLLIENRTIKEAVDKIRCQSEFGWTTLQYYPPEAENYIIPNCIKTNLSNNICFIIKRVINKNLHISKLLNLSPVLILS
jgi:hypothetical protein